MAPSNAKFIISLSMTTLPFPGDHRAVACSPIFHTYHNPQSMAWYMDESIWSVIECKAGNIATVRGLNVNALDE
jgi:hypothetical protein